MKYCLFAALLVLAACSTDDAYRLAAPSEGPPASRSPAAEGRVSAQIAADAPGSVPAGGAASAPADAALQSMASAQKLVRTGSLSVEVADTRAALRRIEEIAAEHGGYVAGMQGSRSAGSRMATVTIRVAPQRFMHALAALRELGEVEGESVTTQDVGREYADLEARLRTKRAAAERMQQLMREKTASLNDVLYADQQLTSVLEQIEQLEGQRRYFDQQVGLSTLTAAVHEAGAPTAASVAHAPFLEPARQALSVARDHLSSLVGVLVYLVVIAAPWSALVLLAWLLGRRMRARRARVGA